MSKINIRNILYAISIILLIIFIILITLIHFYYIPIPVEIVDDLSDSIEILYDDTSNVTFVNSKNGDHIEKRFSVKNISDSDIYYSIVLSNVTNNLNEGSLYYKLDSDKGAYVKKAYIINGNYNIASIIKLKSSETHNYLFKIYVNDNDENNKTFSSNIKVNVISKEKLYEDNTLYSYILNNNVKSEKEIDNETDGIYYTNNTINGSTVYFYRGSNNLNNNVVLGNYCYKIIRTTEDMGIRIIYNGLYKNKECSGEDNVIGYSKYNNNSNYNAYVGYIYGNANSSTYNKEHENINPSVIMNNVNSFYQNNISKYSSYLLDSVYCSNRSTSSFILNSVKYGIEGYKNYNTGYKSMYRIINDENSLKCENDNDKLNSKVLSYPIGLLTASEAVYAGLDIDSENDNYLNSSNSYWTLSPSYYNGINAYNFIVKEGKLTVDIVNKEHGVRPVLTLNNNVKIKSGSGSYNNPFILE